ncbi:SAM-dependent methyltransferase [Bradyrhizobium lablabi]|uniref:SAM-dependent methyltransferase n=1 Tax=Bradyrhizobium lablabi TaxID=722472 RepID=UPI0024C0664E|nr:SAM-dependent methyltransferase [Bradyrhizobium lablabi]
MDSWFLGQPVNATCSPGHAAGAETCIAMLKKSLVEVERVQCQGQSANEDCLIACFRKPH